MTELLKQQKRADNCLCLPEPCGLSQLCVGCYDEGSTELEPAWMCGCRKRLQYHWAAVG